MQPNDTMDCEDTLTCARLLQAIHPVSAEELVRITPYHRVDLDPMLTLPQVTMT